MLARRRHAGIHHRGNDDVDVGALGEVAVLRLGVGPLEVVDARGDGDVAAEVVGGPVCTWPAGELGQPVHGEVDLARAAPQLEAVERVQMRGMVKRK